ncbi:clotting factor G beta subunit-like [Zophobas morio]|uniref:clotting factor G beta subunit-like n=1 Tax=Zophobas morio TaxID=2755281 RepID=UPI0030838133
MLYLKYLILILFIKSKTISTENLIANSCTLRPTEETEVICKPKDDCPWALKFIQKNGYFPWTCGNENSLVCCRVRKSGIISKKMCAKYASLAYEEMDSPTMLAHSSPIKVFKCGQGNAGLIIGGKVTENHEFPHMVLIGFVQNGSCSITWECGGTILSEYYILTAAHCLNHTEKGLATYIKTGITHRRDKNYARYTIAQRIPHPKYQKNSYYHDIALLKLDEPIQLGPHVKPACLYTAKHIPVNRGIVTGWGCTRTLDNKFIPSDNLLKLKLEIFNHTFCNRSYKPYFNRHFKEGIYQDTQFCAGPSDWTEEKDACPGDSGGPMQIFHPGDDVECMYDIIGVVSFGKACPSSSGIYVNVSAYIGWIENIVWP